MHGVELYICTHRKNNAVYCRFSCLENNHLVNINPNTYVAAEVYQLIIFKEDRMILNCLNSSI